MDNKKLSTGCNRSLTDLPLEILSFIAIKLPILELLRFRVTCKDLRSASSAATAKIQSSKKPWLLVQKTIDSKCILYNNEDSKTYNLKIPDLDGATCLASYQGWLLLFKNKLIYFYSPFSHYKITLPEFPHEKINGHVGVFTHVPTSSNCIISIINPIENAFEINVLSIGENAWTRYTQFHYFFVVKPIITAATFDHTTNTFYYMYGKNLIMTFSVKEKKWNPYTIVSAKESTKDTTPFLPYVYDRNKFHDAIKDQKLHQLLELEDGEYVDVCGLTYEPENRDPMVYTNETLNVSSVKTRVCKAIWIEPRFYEVNKDTNKDKDKDLGIGEHLEIH